MNGCDVRSTLRHVVDAIATGAAFGAMTLAALPANSAPPPRYNVQVIGTLGGTWSQAYGLNDAGHVVGVSGLAGSGTAPFLFTPDDGIKNLNHCIGGGLKNPAELVFGPDATADGNDDLYVMNRGASSVTLFDGVSGECLGDFVRPGSGGLDRPNHATFGPDGDLYISSFSGGARRNTIKRYDGQTGAYAGDFVPPGDGGLAHSHGLKFGTDVTDDGAPDLFVCSADTDEVLIYDGLSGEHLGAFVTAGAGGLDCPLGMTFGPDQDDDDVADLYVSSNFTDEVLLFSGFDGEFLGVFVEAESGGCISPNDVEFGPDGNLYLVAGATAKQVLCFDGESGEFSGIVVNAGEGGAGTGTLFGEFGPDGRLYVSSESTRDVLLYDGSGTYVARFVPGTQWTLVEPRDISDAGQIVGWGYLEGSNGNQVRTEFLLTPSSDGSPYGTVQSLGVPANSSAVATSINSAGDVCGYYIAGSTYRSFIKRSGGGLTTHTQSGKSIFFEAINDRDGTGAIQTAGYSVAIGSQRVIRYDSQNGVIKDLGILKSGKNAASSGSDLNFFGDVVGLSTNGSTSYFAILAPETGALQNLGALNGKNSEAVGINDLRHVVGHVQLSNNSWKGFAFTPAAGMFQLLSQINSAPASIGQAFPRSVNASGQICGPGPYNPGGTSGQAFLLTPVN